MEATIYYIFAEVIIMSIDRKQCPQFLNDYITYLKVVKGCSERTVEEYFLDIRLFLRYIKKERLNLKENVSNIPIKDFDSEWLKEVTLNEIYDFEYFLSQERRNSNTARSRKTSALKNFFNYLQKRAGIIDKNPASDIEFPSLKKTIPKYLTLDESVHMLASIDSPFQERDFCIITLFLNCGMRLSELVGLDISDVNLEEKTMRILGKGNKERQIYLNEACVNAINECLKVRKPCDTKALFVSKKKRRISKRRVQQVVEQALKNANLDNRGFSTHKLRHTAATLMYQHGGVDTLILKEILGHESINTTQIYTHVNDNQMKQAIESSPLSHYGVSQQETQPENIDMFEMLKKSMKAPEDVAILDMLIKTVKTDSK